MKIYLASGNLHKKAEMQALFPEHSIVIPKDEDIYFDPEETGCSFLENSLLKATALWNMCSAKLPTALVGQLLVFETIFSVIYAHIHRMQLPTLTLTVGFIDVMNVTKQQVLQDMAVACQIENDYRVIGLGAHGWWKKMMSSVTNSPLVTGEMQHQILSNINNNTTEMFYYLDR